MKKNILIQKAKISDNDKVADLVISLLNDMNAKREDKFVINIDAYLKTTTELLKRDDSFVAYLAYDKDNSSNPIGLMTIVSSFAIYNFGDYGTITELYVSPEYRSIGLGNLFIEKAKIYGNDKGWSILEVGAPIEEEWPRTFQFYIKNKFKPKGPKLRLDF